MSKEVSEEVVREMAELFYNTPISSEALAEKFGFAVNLKCKHGAVTRLFECHGMRQKKDMSLTKKKYGIDESFFDQIDSEVKAYALGFIYADGNMAKPPRNHISIGLKSSDAHILYAIKDALKYEGDILFYDYSKHRVKKNRKKAAVLAFCSKAIYQALSKCGVTPCKSLTIKFPGFIRGGDKNILRHFVRGVFDGDGGIRVLRRRCGGKDFQAHICGNEGFCIDLLSVVREESKVNFRIYNSSCPSIKIIQVGGNRQVKKFLDWLYKDATIFLHRKHIRYLHLKRQTGSILAKKSSQYAGVYKDGRTGKFIACCRLEGKRIFAGHNFLTEDDANNARYELVKSLGINTLQMRLPLSAPGE